MAGVRVAFAFFNAVQIIGNFLRRRTRQQPEIPPTELAQHNLPEMRWILQDEAGDLTVRGDIESSRGSHACTKDHNRTIPSLTL